MCLYPDKITKISIQIDIWLTFNARMSPSPHPCIITNLTPRALDYSSPCGEVQVTLYRPDPLTFI